MLSPVVDRPPRAVSIRSADAPVNASGLRGAFGQHRFLIRQLTRREVVGRYRGSHLGIVWSFANPLLLLCIYTFVFKYFFNAKFTGHNEEGWADYGLQLFSGLIIFNLFAECLGRAPTLILANANYVTKVVFPLEMLPLTVVLGSLLHLLIAFVMLCLAAFVTRDGHLHVTVALWPLLLVPISFWALGITWMISALGAFLRDLNEAMLAITQIIMYASAVFYPLSRLDKAPLGVQVIIRLNPLAFFSEQSRKLVIYGQPMNWGSYGWVTLAGFLFMILGYKVFMNVKQAFADVI